MGGLAGLLHTFSNASIHVYLPSRIRLCESHQQLHFGCLGDRERLEIQNVIFLITLKVHFTQPYVTLVTCELLMRGGHYKLAGYSLVYFTRPSPLPKHPAL